jgi:hypothetical protein
MQDMSRPVPIIVNIIIDVLCYYELIITIFRFIEFYYQLIIDVIIIIICGGLLLLLLFNFWLWKSWYFQVIISLMIWK